MLVLARFKGEVIRIGDDIEIQIVDIRGDKVRLGVTAPKDVTVHRQEVYDEIHAVKKAPKPDKASKPDCNYCNGSGKIVDNGAPAKCFCVR